jgi:indolepyruvate ferredoxin oxidoreductase beta subunit
MLDYLRKTVKNLVIVDGEDICKQCGSPKVLNVALLGAALGTKALDITMDEVKTALKKRLPEKLHEMNMKALELGTKACAERG